LEAAQRQTDADMRFKVILFTAALALAIVAAAVYYRYAPGSPPPAPSQTVSDVATSDDGASSPPSAAAAPARRTQVGAPQQGLLLPADESGAELTASNHADYVLERKAQLVDLTTSSDPAALKTILSELNNRDPEIRKAALSATVEVGNPDAVPALQNQLAWAEDPQEKVEIQNAIDFLGLPSADSVKEEAMAAQAANEPPAAEGN
jgi:HEAT repeat protein